MVDKHARTHACTHTHAHAHAHTHTHTHTHTHKHTHVEVGQVFTCMDTIVCLKSGFDGEGPEPPLV